MRTKRTNKKLIALYKFLSPTHLLKLFRENDCNQLNKKFKEFYAELLHILGLEERSIKGKSQKVIGRKGEGKRDRGVLSLRMLLKGETQRILFLDYPISVNTVK